MTSLLLDVRRGTQKPRVSSWPNYAYSSGQDVVDLCAAAGLNLDPWQSYVLDHALGERPDGRWSSAEVCCVVPRQNGKGTLIEARVLAGLFLFGERLIVWTAHEYKTAQEGFLRIRRLIQEAPEFDALVKRYWEGSGEQGIELKSGQRLRFLARSKSSGRGFSGDLVVLDESFALTAEQVEALLPTLSARPNPQIWYMSSPSLDAVSGAALMDVRKRGVVGSPGLAYFDWGAEPSVDLDDRDVWYQTNPALGIRITEDAVARERNAMTDQGFARERLGIWPPDGDASWKIIPEAEWNDAQDASSTTARPVAACIEVNLERTQACIAIAGRREGDRSIRHVYIRRAEPGTAWVVADALALQREQKVCAFVVDSGGPAGSLIPDLEAAGIEVLKPSVRDMAGACGSMRDGIAGKAKDGEDLATVRNLRHLGQDALTAAVAGLTGRKVSETEVWERAGLGFLAVGGALALWGHAMKSPSDYDPLNSVFVGGG